MSLHPTVLWAQRKDQLFLTIDIQDCKEPKIDLEDSGKVIFRGNAHSHATGPEEHAYVLDLELYGEIVKEDSKQGVTDRTVTLVIAKKDEGHWPRLLKQGGKSPQYIKVDWDKWVDEDEEEEAGGMPPGFDMSQLQGMGGMGGMGGGMGGMGGGMGGMDMSQLMAQMGGGGMGGMMGGMGGADIGNMDFGEGGDLEGEDSDDDEDLPPLEPAPGAA